MKQFILQFALLFFASYSLVAQLPGNLTSDDPNFFPEDITIVGDVAYVSSLGDGTVRMFNLNDTNPIGEIFAAAEVGYSQAWGLKSDGTTLLSILDNADFSGGPSGPTKLVAYDIASKTKTGEWDLPAGAIGHTVSMVDGKYYLTDFGQPRIFEIDPNTGTVNDSWFTSAEWDPSISGIGGTIYDNEGGFYVSQGNKLWYLPISTGIPGTLQEVTVDGLSIIDADGISWDDTNNTLYYATNDTGDPSNVGTAYRLVFTDATKAKASTIASGLDDSSGLWYYEKGGKPYVFVLESQFGALFGINSFDPPFNIEIIALAGSSSNTASVYNSFEDATLTGGQQAFYGAAGPVVISDEMEFPQFINFYDIDVNDFGLTMTLFNNSDAADLILPDGRFDRYYFAFEGDMSKVSISGGSPGLTAGASVSPLPAGYEIPLADLFGTGYPLPVTLPNGGFVLELGGGTDLTDLGQTISVDFGFSGVSVYNSFEDATLTGGQQAFYGAAGPELISDNVEFPQFINFYDIDVNDFGLTMTLFNNSDAADLILPDGRFDRYYFAIDQDMSNVSISGGSPGLTTGASVSPLPVGYEIPLTDLFGTGYPLPITLPNGGFVLELGGGTDLTDLGQTISVDFGLSGVSVYNSFEDATLTGGQQGFFGAAGPEVISDKLEFPNFIGFYDIDVYECGVEMTLVDNSGASDVLLPDGRFDRYYFAMDQEMADVSVLGGSPGLTVNASVTPLPAGYEVPVADLFGTGYPLPITLPNGGFVLELGGGTDLTELGQTIRVDFGCPVPDSLVVNDNTFFPEDIVIANDVAYVSGLGDGTIRYFDLTQSHPAAALFADAETGYTQAWGVKVAGDKLLSLLNNADFGGGISGPAKLVEYDIASKTKTAEWDLPAGAIGHTVSMVDGKYYVGDFGQPRIFEVDPAGGTVNDSWFTSTEWDPTISGMGGIIYDNEGGFYASQGNKLWYVPISGGSPGTMQEVSIDGISGVDADGISWDDTNNILYYATNDTGDPANVGTVYELVFSDATNATGSEIATGLDDSSGLWYYESDGDRYAFVLESQFGALFGINGFEPPFNIEIIPLGEVVSSTENILALSSSINVYPNPFDQVVSFELELKEGDDFQLIVFDATGKIVSSRVLKLYEGTNKFNFDGSALSNGFYSYRLSNLEGFISGKLLLNR